MMMINKKKTLASKKKIKKGTGTMNSDMAQAQDTSYERKWYMPRWDSVLREVRVLMRVNSSAQCVIYDPESDDTSVVHAHYLHDTPEGAKELLSRFIEGIVYNKKRDIVSLGKEIKELQKELASIRKKKGNSLLSYFKRKSSKKRRSRT